MQKVTGVKKPRKGSYPPEQWTALVEQINRTLLKWNKEHGAKNVFRYQNGQVNCRMPHTLTLTCTTAARPYFSAGFGCFEFLKYWMTCVLVVLWMPLIHGFCRLVDLRNLFRAPRAIAISAQVDLETAETPETRETPNTEVKAPLRSRDSFDTA